jgi:hypothetical protein
MNCRILPALALALVCSAMCGCGFSLGLPVGPSQGGSQSFRCGGPGMSIKFTTGTGDLPGSVTVMNLKTNNSKTLGVDPRTPAGGAASSLNLACSDVNVRCALETFDTVKVCGKQGEIEVQATQIQITSNTFKND